MTALQTIGLPAGTTGNTLASANPMGTITDELSNDSSFRTDRFGNVTSWTNPLSLVTTIERDARGLAAREPLPDPDGGGSLTSPVTVWGYDELGNVTYQRNPDDTTRDWTYTTFSLVATEVDELDRTIAYSRNSDGTIDEITDADGFVTGFQYNARGQVTSETRPDPDGPGSLSASVTEFAYDSYGRLVTITHPDDAVIEFTYNSADQRLTVTDELDQVTTYLFDGAGRRIRKTGPISGAQTDYTFDNLDRVTRVQFPAGSAGGSNPMTQPRRSLTRITSPSVSCCLNRVISE